MSDLRELINKLEAGIALRRGEIEVACEALFDEGRGINERAEFLQALAKKGETAGEIADFVQVLLLRATIPTIPPELGPLLDVCGTGGDCAGLFNVSTAVMFVVAACGARVVKHGNRGITSKSGGADVLEALGVRIDVPPADVGNVLERAGCCFLFAPNYHASFKAVGPVRKFLAAQGTPTIFNKLGPLLNPAKPAYQLAGVFDPRLPSVYVETFRLLGRERAWAVHGTGPENLRFDEVSPLGQTTVFALEDGLTREFIIHPDELGIQPGPLSDLKGGEAAENAQIIRNILSGANTGGALDIVLLNAAASLVVAGVAGDLTRGLATAREAIEVGRALEVLARLR